MARARTEGRVEAQGVRNARLKLLVLAGLCLLPVLGGLQMGLSGQSWLPLALYPAVSVISLLLYWQDKQQARTQAWRTPEKVLHASELLGGWPGALLAQQLLRHKTRKLSYQLVFWAIVAVHQLFWIDHLLLNGRWLGHWF
ncbi:MULTISPECIES: DUF1294 domain-containing protein [unclassified Pseudomonas]|uniref:DUF1294 domain-containing protein n=1 Tax=unclassified Pseudomonas TaxID=196821 RepID=UPI0020985E69|nr:MULTISPECIES: DUF1294 domain-containing protein [unclassified Pseudomonas]MCO7519291.1 DUF1294 domain-containing protein [Pseudomonas sp. 1]MCO7541726.1 DUF1294 domain-containing protein [Pseudomonas sp. VA159-2]